MDKSLVGPATVDGDHLPPERLAALADEPPTAAEARHLASCPVCSEEVVTYQALLVMTRGERDSLDEPLLDWGALSTALAREHLLDGPGAAEAVPARGRRYWPRLGAWGQAVAATLLLGAGITVGRATARPAATADPSATSTSTATAVGQHNGIIAAVSHVNSDSMPIRSRDEALTALQQAETQYRHAVAYLMQSDSGALKEGADGFRTRLAALDQVERATRAALAAAPNDPVLNQWYISTVGARQATMRQLGEVQPAAQNPHRY
jgi:hypothetical protein